MGMGHGAVGLPRTQRGVRDVLRLSSLVLQVEGVVLA